MPAIFLYLLKSIVCSGILFGFYRLAYYNRLHHQWNRFYLLTAVLISLALPIISVYIPRETNLSNSPVVTLLNVVASKDIPEEKDVYIQSNNFDVLGLINILYIFVSVILLVALINSLIRIARIYRSNPRQRFRNYQLVLTQEHDAPFSFFRNVFWNTRIKLDSASGERILAHEEEHVRQLHSIDRLFINVVTAVFWCNPFFWLIRNELIAVHEFAADRKAIHNNHPQDFAMMLLVSLFPGKNLDVTSTFYNSSIKRRLTMITTLKSSKVNAVGKWLVLPLIIILFAGFSLRKKEVFAGQPSATFKLVIDAGHGGSSSGVSAPDGTREKDLTLAIAHKIKKLNNGSRIQIIMTREGDESTPLDMRVENSRRSGADAFLSIHINNAPPTQSGIQLMMTRNVTEYADKSQMLGSLLSQELSKVFKVDGELRKGADKGVWVLDAPEINYPSVLIEFGNLNNPADLEFVKSEKNQEKLAKQVLTAVAMYAEGVK